MIIDKINKYLWDNELKLDDALKYEVEKLAGWTFKRQFMENGERDNKGKLYLSSVGKCPRQLAYGYHGFEKKGKEIDGRAKIIFWTGDLIELTVVNLAKLAGVILSSTGFNQITLNFSVNGAVIQGHPDGLVIEPKEILLLEVKSMSSYGFRKFEKGIIDETYLIQVNCYMEALGINRCVFVALNKDNGIMNEIILEKSEEIVEQSRKNITKVLHSSPEKLPEPNYKADEKGMYPWQCLYCAYWGHCHPNAEKVLVGKAYKLKEKKDKSNGRDITT